MSSTIARPIIVVALSVAALWACAEAPAGAGESADGGAAPIVPVDGGASSTARPDAASQASPAGFGGGVTTGTPEAGGGGTVAPQLTTAGTTGAAGSRGASTPEAGAGSAGTGGAAGRVPTFAIGADISWVPRDERSGATYIDRDGTQKDILQLLGDHGFNYIRLRTFVDPRAAGGYDEVDGDCDLAHTLAFGARIKRAGMGFLLDFHYSDNWADPGKQCVPVAWQNLTTIDALAGALHDYTKDAVSELVAAGARPDIVQIGNEIAPGMLLHRCDGDGQPIGTNPVTGSISNWSDLGALLRAGSEAVKAVDPSIRVMLHIDRCDELGASRDFIEHALEQAVEFELFGESCYTAYQGQPSEWRSTFTQLAAEFPALGFVIAEYGPEQRAANDVIFELPDQRGLGTFNWEPTHPGAWNMDRALFDVAGNVHTAATDLQVYDGMKTAYADRL